MDFPLAQLFCLIGNCVAFPIKQKALRGMRTRAKKKYVASDRARRENVPRHILFYFIGNCVAFPIKQKKRSAWIALRRNGICRFATRRRRRILRSRILFLCQFFVVSITAC